MKKTLTLLMAILATLTASAINKQTYTFSATGADTLKMDVYRPASPQPTPALIFAFGGAFTHGQRDDARYVPFFEFLADNGVLVVSTDYRTRLKDLTPAEMSSVSAFVGKLVDAVTCATTDFYRATGYVLAHAAEWNINPAQIFACGSSAGAITALQAEYELCNNVAGVPGFPPAFNYAGVVSFAGAIMAEGEPDWVKTPAPMLFFHGNADSNVPFSEAIFSGNGLWGPVAITKSLADKGVNFWFHRFEGADHSIAISPMDNNCGEVLDFIRQTCAGKANLVETVEIVAPQGTYRTDFTIKDYIKANMQ